MGEHESEEDDPLSAMPSLSAMVVREARAPFTRVGVLSWVATPSRYRGVHAHDAPRQCEVFVGALSSAQV